MFRFAWMLLVASKSTSLSSFGAVGVNVNTAERLRGGVTTPGGTSRMLTTRATALAKSVPAGVTAIWTMVPGSLENGGDGGAVYTSVALPDASVTRFLADNVPKSAMMPLTVISARTGRFGSG